MAFDMIHGSLMPIVGIGSTRGECPVCGKAFTYTAEHVWKVSIKNKQEMLCSYTCMRKAQTQKAAMRKKREDPKRTRKNARKGRAKRVPLVERDLLGNEINKVKMAIERLQLFCPKEGYYLCFSGGKDSVCIKALADMAGVKYDAHYNVTTVDPPELVRFIYQQHPDVAHDRPEKSMWRLIVEKRMPPTRICRYCCEELKERKSVGRIAVTGVRWAESVGRRKSQGGVTVFNGGSGAEIAEREGAEYKKTQKGGIVLNMDNDESRRVVEQCGRTHTVSVNPIINWTDKDVWEFIRREKLSYCELYDEGFQRLGCVGCPMGGAKQMQRAFERWPAYYNLYLLAFDKMLKARIKDGLKTEWESADEVMAWWLEKTILKPMEGQISIDELEGD